MDKQERSPQGYTDEHGSWWEPVPAGWGVFAAIIAAAVIYLAGAVIGIRWLFNLIFGD